MILKEILEDRQRCPHSDDVRKLVPKSENSLVHRDDNARWDAVLLIMGLR